MRNRNEFGGSADILSRRRVLAGGIVAAVGVGMVGLMAGRLVTRSHAQVPRLPPVLHDVPVTDTIQTAVLAGGCFWGVQGVFQQVAGVISATAGYAGGTADTATYELVESGRTDHAEAVEIKFDPHQITYGQILEIFLSVAHDPTEVDRQGPDIGKHYRSAIFPLDEDQATVAANYVAQLRNAAVFKRPIATSIELGATFFKAEDYHQDYMFRNPNQPYIYINDRPKVEKLQLLFPDIYREKPVLTKNYGD